MFATVFDRILRPMLSRAHRRIGALFAAGFFFTASVVVPFLHLAEHSHSRPSPERIDVDSLRDESGRVPLDRLAEALGLGEPHDESRPHRHGPGPEGHHGEGSIAHLMLALGIAAPPLVEPLASVFTLLGAEPREPESRTPALAFLSAQRSQAPPAL